MTTGVSRAAVEGFAQDGYAIFRDVVDAELVGAAGEHVEWLQERHPHLRGEELGHTLIADDPFWVDLVGDSRLLDIVEMFIGPDIALYASHYISKPAFSGQAVLWHQDAAFWNLEPMKVVTLWLAVDASDRDNGCLRVIPGSHRSSIAAMTDSDGDDLFGAQIAGVDDSMAVDLELAPGDVEVHHPNIIHGSRANLSSRRRCGLTIRYIPTSTRITGDEQPFASAFHLRGDPGVNVYQPRPSRGGDGEFVPRSTTT
jgi:ectoine hydroxylase-related dioxygenase (phytanoyl-CoA dioxygenase family)